MSNPIYVFIPPGRIVSIEEEHAALIAKYVRLYKLPATEADRDAALSVVQDVFLEHALHTVVVGTRKRVQAWRDAKSWWMKHAKPSLFWIGFGRVDQRVTTTLNRSTWVACRTAAAEARKVAKEIRNPACGHEDCRSSPHLARLCAVAATLTVEDMGDWNGQGMSEDGDTA